MKINKLFLDMDGVLADFQLSVFNTFGKPYNVDEASKYDFWESWGVTREDVNAVCDRKFWANLPWTADGREILDIVGHQFRTENIYLLTNPVVGGPETAAGKMEWIIREVPELYSNTIITSASKGLLAQPDALLIDDADFNVENFEQAGGNTILINRPWNAGSKFFDLTTEALQLALRHYDA